MENSNFLKKKYDLHNAPEVESASIRAEKLTGEKIPQNPEDKIQNYLDRFKEIFERKDLEDREIGIQALKKVLLEKFVTKFEEIPESWHALNERIVRERGQGGDWDRYSPEQKEKERRQQAEAVLADQEASLEQWIDYIASEDSSYMPDYIKYWVFRSITDLSEYDKEKSEFPKRSKGTVKMFPDINQEALAYVIDAISKKQEGESMDFGRFTADLTRDQMENFRKSLIAENFAKLYSWANEQIHPIAKHLMPITEGEWKKYTQDKNDSENYKLLNQSIRGRGTGWCTAGENTAKSQLQNGDFYCYYTIDDDKKAVIPRIAIRMAEGKIAEVRGIAYKQNLDPYMGDVLAEKLEEFPDKEEYLKKDADMKKLTALEQKTKKGEIFTKDDLMFLYEIDTPIKGFGYSNDPRIGELHKSRQFIEDFYVLYGYDPLDSNLEKKKLDFIYGISEPVPESLKSKIKEILSERNTKEDVIIIFNLASEQVAIKQNEVTEETKMYVGALFPGIFQKNIEHIYTSFPEGKITKYNMEIGGRSKEQLHYDLNNGKYRILKTGEEVFSSNEWSPSENIKNINLIRLTVKDLGYPSGTKIGEIYKSAKELGLAMCPAETGPMFRFLIDNTDSIDIGMEPIFSNDDKSFRKIFFLSGTHGDLLALRANPGEPHENRAGHDNFVFCVSEDN